MSKKEKKCQICIKIYFRVNKMKYTEIKILIKKSNCNLPFYTIYNKIFKKMYQHENQSSNFDFFNLSKNSKKIDFAFLTKGES